MNQEKPEIITFKVPKSLSQALKGMQNRSEFIREAVLAALDSVCPLCKGSGILTVEQKAHWQGLLSDHYLSECGTCKAVHLVCRRAEKETAHEP